MWWPQWGRVGQVLQKTGQASLMRSEAPSTRTLRSPREQIATSVFRNPRQSGGSACPLQMEDEVVVGVEGGA